MKGALLAPWTLSTAVLAPLALVVGMVAGAFAQPASFDSTVQTISDLAGLAARERWIMTSALAVLGIAHAATALGLRAAAWPGRSVLLLGGISIVLVAVFPLTREGMTPAHSYTALSAFVCMTGWPLLAMRSHASGTHLLRPRVSLVASAVLFALLAWFGYAARVGSYVGLSERVLAVAQSLWPLLVVLDLRRPIARQPEAALAASVEV